LSAALLTVAADANWPSRTAGWTAASGCLTARTGQPSLKKRWPIGLSLMDMAWGACLSVVAAIDGKALMDWAAPL